MADNNIYSRYAGIPGLSGTNSLQTAVFGPSNFAQGLNPMRAAANPLFTTLGFMDALRQRRLAIQNQRAFQEDFRAARQRRAQDFQVQDSLRSNSGLVSDYLNALRGFEEAKNQARAPGTSREDARRIVYAARDNVNRLQSRLSDADGGALALGYINQRRNEAALSGQSTVNGNNRGTGSRANGFGVRNNGDIFDYGTAQTPGFNNYSGDLAASAAIQANPQTAPPILPMPVPGSDPLAPGALLPAPEGVAYNNYAQDLAASLPPTVPALTGAPGATPGATPEAQLDALQGELNADLVTQQTAPPPAAPNVADLATGPATDALAGPVGNQIDFGTSELRNLFETTPDQLTPAGLNELIQRNRGRTGDRELQRQLREFQLSQIRLPESTIPDLSGIVATAPAPLPAELAALMRGYQDPFANIPILQQRRLDPFYGGYYSGGF